MPTLSPNRPDYSAQIEELNTQVANLQNLVNALQNQQTNPSTTLPQSSFTSKSTSIPTVSQVVILSQNSMPTGIQVSVGFTTPLGVMVNLIDHYNVWFQTGAAGVNINPTVIVSTKKSPCIFTIPSINGTTPGIVGVQTVMRDGQILPFPLCPTTALTLTLASSVLVTDNPIGVALTASTNTNVGTSTTISTAGTYLININVEAVNTSGTTGNVVCGLKQNGTQISLGWTIDIANAGGTGSNNLYFLVSVAANDVFQVFVNSTVTANYNFIIQKVFLKQFVS